jgi:chlorite dismutase
MNLIEAKIYKKLYELHKSVLSDIAREARDRIQYRSEIIEVRDSANINFVHFAADPQKSQECKRDFDEIKMLEYLIDDKKPLNKQQ